MFGYEVEGTGSVTLNVMAGKTYYVGIADFSSSDATNVPFNVSIEEGEYVGDGTANAPAELVTGEASITLPEWWNPVYYAFVADANGTLTLTTDSQNVEWYLTLNLVGENYTVTDGTISITLAEGEIAYLYAAALGMDEDTILVNVAFEGEAVEPAGPSAVTVELAVGSTNNVMLDENTYAYAELYIYGDYVITWGGNASVTVNGVIVSSGDIFTAASPRMATVITIAGADYSATAVELSIEAYVAPAPEAVLGENTANVANSWQGATVTFTAPEDKTYVFTPGANCVIGYDYSNYFEGDTLEIALAAGESVELMLFTADYEPGEVSFTISEKEEVVVPPVEEGDATGTELEFTVPNYFASSPEQTFTAAASGEYVITAEGYDSIQKTYLQYYDGSSWVRIEGSLPYTITLTAGETVRFRLYCWNSADTGMTITVVITPAE